MSNLFEEAERVLENRRIHSEIRLHDKIAGLHAKFPQLAEVEKEISRVTGEQLMRALDGKDDGSLSEKLSALDAKRETILTECGLTNEDFTAVPYCKLCGDTGYVTGKDGESKMCTCLCALLAPVFLSRSGVNKYPGFSFAKADESFWDDNEAGKNAFAAVKALAEHKMVPNLIFSGPSGCGKTFAAVCAAREYAEHGMSSLVIKQADAQELMMEHRKIVQAFRTDADKEKTIENRRRQLVEADLLVLDDMGVEANSGNGEADLLYILDARLLAGKATIMTTNYDIPTLKDRYGARVYDRIVKNFKVYSFSRKKGE